MKVMIIGLCVMYVAKGIIFSVLDCYTKNQNIGLLIWKKQNFNVKNVETFLVLKF